VTGETGETRSGDCGRGTRQGRSVRRVRGVGVVCPVPEWSRIGPAVVWCMAEDTYLRRGDLSVYGGTQPGFPLRALPR
jgi:hypothetical protein